MRDRGRSASTVLIAGAVLLPAILAIVSWAPPAQGAAPHIFESVEPPAAMGDSADKNVILAQSFVATANYKLLWVEVYAIDLGTPDLATIEIRQDSGGFPSIALVASGQVQGGLQYSWLRIDVSPQPILVAGSRYWIEFISHQNSPDAYLWAKAVSNNYTAGWAANYQGSAWTMEPTVDYLFRTWGIQGPSIAVGISVDATSAGAGDPLLYTVDFDNIGTATASTVWVNWTPSTGVTYVSDDASVYGGSATAKGWVFQNVDPGANHFHISVRTNENVFEGLPLTTTVELEYVDGKIQQEPSSASATTIARVPSLIVGASASPLFLSPGDSLGYTISVSNVGSRSAKRVWLNDTLPPEVTYVSDTSASLPNLTGSWRSGNTIGLNFSDVPGGVMTFTINATVNLGTRNGTWLVNWAFVNYTDSAGRLRESVKASAVARVHGASIRIAQSTVVTGVQPREIVRFVLRFDNAGDDISAHVWINDSLPSGLTYYSDTASAQPSFVNGTCLPRSCAWEFANVAPGPQSFNLLAAVALNLPDGMVLRNWANLSYLDSNEVPLDPSSSSVTIQVSRPWFALRVSVNQYSNPGDALGYFVRLDNQGSGTADIAWLNVTFAPGTTYAADNASDSGGVRTGPRTWMFRNLTSGPAWMFLAVQLASGLADRTVLTSLFTLEFVDDEGNSGVQETATATVVVTAPVLSAQTFANRVSVEVGMTVTFTVLVDNSGSGVASDLWINDTIPDGTSFVRSSHQYVSTSGSVYTWHLTDVSPGIEELNVTVRVDGDVRIGAVLRNHFLIAYTDANGNFIANDEGATDVLVVGSALGPGLTLPITVLILGIVVAMLVGFIGWKVYGVGSKDKPRVDELFLLHRSGELVRHLTRSLRPNVDSDALSGMLVAVQDFIKESFRFVQGSLEELKFGSHRIMLAHGKHLIVAAVVAGGHTERLAPVILSGLDAIERDFAPALKDWNGMPSALEGVDGYLGEMLKGKAPNGKPPHAPRAEA